MMVKTISRHQNAIGDSFVKNPGKIYDAGDQAKMLLEEGLVEVAPTKTPGTTGD